MPSTAAAGFYARSLRKSELLECLALQPEHTGSEVIGHEKAIAIWRRMLCNPQCASSVAEATTSARNPKIVAFGFDAPVASWFVDEELSNPQAGLNSRFLALIDAGKPVLLTRENVAAGNAVGGLDFLILASSCLQAFGPAQVSEVSAVLAPTYLAARGGYRVNRIFIETIGPAEEMHFRAMHIFQLVKRFSPNRCLWVSTRPDQTLSVSASFVSPLFHYREPLLRLRQSDQELLLAALDGKTDDELSEELSLSLPAVKKRWMSIFERTVNQRHDLFPSFDSTDEKTRGKQKRHRVLSYVRAHPEELRPFDWNVRLRKPLIKSV